MNGSNTFWLIYNTAYAILVAVYLVFWTTDTFSTIFAFGLEAIAIAGLIVVGIEIGEEKERRKHEDS